MNKNETQNRNLAELKGNKLSKEIALTAVCYLLDSAVLELTGWSNEQAVT